MSNLRPSPPFKPESLIPPLTSSLVEGLVVPMPTFPELSNTALTLLFVANSIPSAPVVPKNILFAPLPINLLADEPSTPIIKVAVVFLISIDFSVFAESSAITIFPDIVPPAKGSLFDSPRSLTKAFFNALSVASKISTESAPTAVTWVCPDITEGSKYSPCTFVLATF